MMNIQNELISGSILSIAVILITGFYIFQYHNKQIKTVATSLQPAVLTAAEVSKHSAASDCWLIIQNNVYNVTNFLDQHPGGSDKIIPFCGKDATQAFLTKGGRGSHSPRALQILESLKIGSLK